MRVSCPSCHSELTLDVLLAHEQARRSVARLAQLSLPFGALTLRYMALFKPESRALSIDRMVRLVDELLPDIERKAITRKGRDWAADIECWRAAIETVLSMRDAGKLRLPLAGHGLLHEVIVGLVEKHERATESQQEQLRRHRSAEGPRDAPPRDLAAIAADLVASPAPAAPPPADGAYRPSRAALETQERIRRHLQLRAGAEPVTEEPKP